MWSPGLRPTLLSVALFAIMDFFQGSDLALAMEDLGKRRALHLAAAHGREAATRALLEAGCETHPRDSVLRWTPLRYADAALRLSPNGQPSSHLDVAERLLCSGANPEHAPRLLRLGKYLLRIAIEKDLAQVTRMLVKEEGPLVVQRRGTHNYMHVAAQYGSYRVIRMLLALDFSVNAKDRRSGRTPLHLAAACGHPDACTLLLQRGARVSSRSRNGRTPLHEAAARGYVSICRILLEAGADPRAEDSEGDLYLYTEQRVGGLSPLYGFYYRRLITLSHQHCPPQKAELQHITANQIPTQTISC